MVRAARAGPSRAFLSADTYPNVRMFEGMSEAAVSALARETVHAAGRAGFWGLDSAAPLVAGTYPAARAAVDVALTTVDRVLGGAAAAYGLCRPPGHHAARSMYGGYCFFNNAAVPAEAIVRSTGERVAILDVDYHHGNGSQQIFWRRGDVRYVSIHAHPDRAYPYFLGRADETGEDAGVGENLNLPLRAGATNQEYLVAVDRALDAITATPGSVIVVSLGFDTYGLDPIGDFALTTDVYHEVGRRVAAAGRRLVILQEGGYHRPSLGENARAWLRGAEGRPFDPLPSAGFGETGAVAG
ncbi:MAG: histone deacetylase family protein [Candidatus Limnocylindrales bacterium]